MTTDYLNGEIDRSSLENNKKDRRIERHKLVEGNNVLRILPPFGTNHGKSAFAEWSLHWGFMDKDGNKRPIVCTYKYEGYCPICEVSRELYKKKTALVKEYMDADNKKVLWDRMPDSLKAQYTKLNQEWEDIKPTTQYFYNAIDLNHSIKILALSKMAHDGLKKKILDAMDKYGISPASLNAGCYFVISKIKIGTRVRDVKYEVDLYKQIEKDAQGNVIERILKTALPDAVINGYDKLAYDIHTLYTVRSSSDVAKILNGDGSVFDQERNVKKDRGNLNPESKSVLTTLPPTICTPAVNGTTFVTPPTTSVYNPPATGGVLMSDADRQFKATTNVPVADRSGTGFSPTTPVAAPVTATPQTVVDAKKLLGY